MPTVYTPRVTIPKATGHSEAGATLAEYALILSLLTVALVGAMTFLFQATVRRGEEVTENSRNGIVCTQSMINGQECY